MTCTFWTVAGRKGVQDTALKVAACQSAIKIFLKSISNMKLKWFKYLVRTNRENNLSEQCPKSLTGKSCTISKLHSNQ